MPSSDRSVILRSKARLSSITINSLPDELLAEIFDCCRLHDEYGWNYQRLWYNPLQVCRRWRYIMLDWSSRLRLRFLCNLANPITTIPSHFPPIPIILSFNYHQPTSPHSQEELLLAFRPRVCAITISGFYWRGLELGSALDNTFPMLETLSLSNNSHELRVLPDNFVAPHLHALHLRGIPISRRSSLLRNATNLSSLRLQFMPEEPVYSHLTPEYLVEHLASMPHLENILFKFYPSSSLPETVGGLPHPQITRAMLPRLARLIYTGIGPYLDNLLSRIDTPFLQDSRLSTLSRENPDVLCLSAFLGTIQNLNLRVTQVSFYPRSATIEYYPERPSVTPYLKFGIDHTHSENHAVASVMQICSAVVPALFSVMESLEIQLRTDYDNYHLDSGLFAEHAHWHVFLQLFRDVKTLRVDKALAAEFSDILHPSNGLVGEELLPILSEIIITVFSKDDCGVHQYFSSFIHARRLSGHSIDLRAIRGRRDYFCKPHISWSFGTFAF